VPVLLIRTVVSLTRIAEPRSEVRANATNETLSVPLNDCAVIRDCVMTSAAPSVKVTASKAKTCALRVQPTSAFTLSKWNRVPDHTAPPSLWT
jgi:hypothetical protein